MFCVAVDVAPAFPFRVMDVRHTILVSRVVGFAAAPAGKRQHSTTSVCVCCRAPSALLLQIVCADPRCHLWTCSRGADHRYAGTAHSCVLRVAAIMGAPPMERTGLHGRFRPRARNVIHPDCPASTAKALHACVRAAGASELATCDRCIRVAPAIIAHCTPLPAVVYLEAAALVATTALQPNATPRRACCCACQADVQRIQRVLMHLTQRRRQSPPSATHFCRASAQVSVEANNL